MGVLILLTGIFIAITVLIWTRRNRKAAKVIDDQQQKELKEISKNIKVEDDPSAMPVEEIEAGTEENLVTERNNGGLQTGSARPIIESKQRLDEDHLNHESVGGIDLKQTKVHDDDSLDI